MSSYKDTYRAILKGMDLDPDKTSDSPGKKADGLAGFADKQAAAKRTPAKTPKRDAGGNGKAIQQLSKGDW